jgi:hypothetical protein
VIGNPVDEQELPSRLSRPTAATAFWVANGAGAWAARTSPPRGRAGWSDRRPVTHKTCWLAWKSWALWLTHGSEDHSPGALFRILFLIFGAAQSYPCSATTTAPNKTGSGPRQRCPYMTHRLPHTGHRWHSHRVNTGGYYSCAHARKHAARPRSL